MLALPLPPEIEQRLASLARKTGRSKSWFACEAILRRIEDIEDTYLARRRRQRSSPRLSLEGMERDLAQPARRQNALLEAFGKLEWDETYNYKADRRRKRHRPTV
jgi:RHH-type rel operon transcriptional repressor/antitoxin RelB